MLAYLPLLIIPLIIFNMPVIGGMLGGTAPVSDYWAEELFSISMMSGGTWRMDVGDGLLVLGLVFLFIEVLKATRTSRVSVIDHVLSTVVFILYLVEFLLVPAAAHPVFFLLGLMALIDLMAGFSVTIRSAGRDVSLG